MAGMDLEHRKLQAPDGGAPFVLALQPQPAATKAVLLLPAIAGVDGYIAQRAAHLAGQGYFVAVLDYYRGSGHRPDLSTPERIGAAVAALDDREVMRDIGLAIQWLASEGFDVASTGLVGFCIGGAFAVLASGDAACAVAYYGQLRNTGKATDPLSAAPNLANPLLVHVGERDRLISAQDIAEFKAATCDSAAAVEVHTYPGAPHAFDEWHRPAVFRPIASEEAWRRTLTFLNHHTRRPS